MLGEQVQALPVRPEFSVPPSVTAQRQVTFDSASSPVVSEKVEHDDAASAVDHSFVRLPKFLYDQYPESRPLLPPRCGFESLFAPADPPESSRPHFRLYPRVQEVMCATRERAVALSRRLQPLSAILPKKNRKHSVADVPDFSSAPTVNPDFSCLTDNKTVSNKRWGSITFLEMEHMGSVLCSLLEGNSHSLWLMSGILSQLKQTGFNPRTGLVQHHYFIDIAYLSSQAQSAAALADFLQLKRSESYVSCYAASVPGPETRVAGSSRPGFWSLRSESFGKDLQPGEGGFLHLLLSRHG